MTFYAGEGMLVAISNVAGTPSFSTLKAIRSCRLRLEHETRDAEPIVDDNWARRSATHLRKWQMTLELYGASHTAHTRLRSAALQDGKVRAKLTLASGAIIEGDMQIERYEEFANEDDALEVEVNLTSTGSVTITGS
ncbi:MAG: phage tail tube protein [Rickettsiales bacterium]